MPIPIQSEEHLTDTVCLYSSGAHSEWLLSLRSKTWDTESHSRKQLFVASLRVHKKGTVGKNKHPGTHEKSFCGLE